VSSQIEVNAGGDATVQVAVKRLADLARDGWFSGDLHVHRPIADIPLLMRAEDLHVAPVITWWNRNNLWKDRKIPDPCLYPLEEQRFYDVMAGEDERQGGALLYFNLKRPLEISQATAEYPSPMVFVKQSREMSKNVWIDIEKPFWWDVPVWLASGQMDSIGLANNHMQHGGMMANEAWGKPRDRTRLPDPLGNGYWSQEIYYQLLNCGLRLPPSAGSASGVLANPVGYNRVYVHLDGELDYGKWWDGLKAGHCIVTNGPLLLCKADGELPGHVFRAAPGKPLELKLDLRLICQDRVGQIEVVKNGRVESAVELEAGQSHHRTASIAFTESGWFLLRAIAQNPQTFRFASTAPFYVEIGDARTRISRRSAEFFLSWVNEREKQLRANVQSPRQLAEVLQYHELARRYWQDLVAKANAD
jgi:hypothetical protein